MGMLLALGLGVVAGWLAWKYLKLGRPMQEMLGLGAITGVLLGFVFDLATTGTKLFANASVNSMGAALFGAVLFILIRRLLVELR